MRLPGFLTEISPVKETLEAMGTGETAMGEAVAERNKQVLVGTADTGLSLWEADYSLPDRTGGNSGGRRLDIRTAMARGRTLTPAYLAELAVTLGGADRGEVEEDFSSWRVVLTAVAEERTLDSPAALERAVEQLKPAHLEVLVTPEGRLTAGVNRVSGLYGGAMMELCGDDIQRGSLGRRVVLHGSVMMELRG